MSRKDSNIGENIRQIRIANRETQEQLGRVLGYGATTIANYESGYRQPDIGTLLEIAKHYNVDITTLIEG